MQFFEDVKNDSNSRSEYVCAWLDNYAVAKGMIDASHFGEDQAEEALTSLCTKLYEDLSILDQKASALISSNSIATAFISLIVVAGVSSGGMLSVNLTIFSAILLIFSVLSLSLNVSVISLYWTTTAELKQARDRQTRARSLLQVRNARTLRFRFSFVTHLAILFSIFCLALVFLLRIADK